MRIMVENYRIDPIKVYNNEVFEMKNLEVHYSPRKTPLSVLDLSNLPFQPKRIYWITAFSKSEPRGFHAHKNLNQILIVVSGSINLVLYRGNEKSEFELHSNDKILIIPRGTWREIYALQDNTTIMVLADRNFEEEDYLRDWVEYLKWFTESGELH